MNSFQIVEVTPENAAAESLFCIKNPKYPGFQLKLQWLKKRFAEGLKFKLLKVDNEMAGFIEYIPGEYACRPVSAGGYLFIQCLWVFPKKNLGKGYGSVLLKHCENEAREQGKNGVAVVASNGSWMSSPALFYKNGFETAEEKGRFVLMVKSIHQGEKPAFINWEQNLPQYQGLNLVYANQCPLFIKSVDEMKETARSLGHDLKVTVLETPADIQSSASGYGVYSLVYNGRLLADHYVSNTRFRNILTKELH